MMFLFMTPSRNVRAHSTFYTHSTLILYLRALHLHMGGEKT